MTLVEMLVLQLGTAIAKTTLKLWLKEPIAVTTATTLTDILSTKTEDLLAHRNAEREFQAIGDKIANSLFYLFEMDGSGLTEAEKESIVNVVRDTLNYVDISSDLLVKQDLKDTVLARYYLREYKNTYNESLMALSPDQRLLYERIINEVAKHMVSIASHLPMFAEASIAEILRRETQIINVALDILADVEFLKGSDERIREEKFIQFEADYRRLLSKKLDKSYLYGVDVRDTTKSRGLSATFIPLTVKKYDRQYENSEVLEETDNLRISSLDFPEAIYDVERAIIIGQPGSGKTTLLKWIAINVARRTYTNKLSVWNSKVPFYIPIREFPHGELPSPEEFVSNIVRQIYGTMPATFVHEQLRRGKSILLIDGLDEIPLSRRRIVYDWLVSLMWQYPNNVFILSSRPHAVDREWLIKNRITEYHIQPWEDEAVYAFIEKWYSTIEDKDTPNDYKLGIVINLRKQIERNTSLNSLVKSPLICTSICALKYEHDYFSISNFKAWENQLLRKYSSDLDIYDACISMFVEKRDVERNIDLESYPKLSYRQKQYLLGSLAYSMLLNKNSKLSRDQMLHHLSAKLENIETFLPNVDSRKVLRLLVERTAIFEEANAESYRFVHLTFQKVLAAQQAVSNGDTGFLASMADSDAWRDVIFFAVGFGSKHVTNDLIMQILRHGDENEEKRYTLYLVALTCRELYENLDPETNQELEIRESRILPPTNISQAERISAAGDLAVPFLGQVEDNRATVVIAVIRALRTIGTPECYDIIAKYQGDKRKTVKRELDQLSTNDSEG